MIQILVPLPKLDFLEGPKIASRVKCQVCDENPEFEDLKLVQEHRESGKHRFRYNCSLQPL